MKKIIPLVLLFSATLSLFSQKLVSIEHQETVTKEELSTQFFGFPINYGIEAFKVLYETPDTDGTLDTASGLLVIPLKTVQDEVFPSLAYQHGTASERNSVPSNPEAFERRLVYYFAGQGYYTTAADYLGLGDSRRIIHPYIHSATEASAGIDLVKAARSYIESQGLPINQQLFLTGYSQGGHAAMAMHKELNETPIPGVEVAAGSHMSGIYNVSGELVKASISENVYLFPSYPVWIAVGYQSVYGNLYTELSDIFRSDYVPSIKGFVEGVITRGELNDLLINELVKNHEASIPKFLFTESFINELESNPDSPFRQALIDNDLFNWVPSSPLRMMYCTADDQVAFTNSTFTDSIMNANGAEDVLAIDVNSEADHGGCVIPAVFNTVTFFEEFTQRGQILSAKEIDNTLNFRISPNPASEFIQLNFKELTGKFTEVQIRLISAKGQVVKEIDKEILKNIRIPLNDISSGLYLMQVQSENGFWTEKIIVK